MRTTGSILCILLLGAGVSWWLARMLLQSPLATGAGGPFP